MSSGQTGNIQHCVRTVRIHPRIQVYIVGAVQAAVYFYAVVAGNFVIHSGSRHAFQAADIGFRSHVHYNFIAAAKSNIAAVFVFSGLFQLRILIYSNLICGRNIAVAVHIHIFGQTAALAFHLIGDICVAVGVINLAFLCSHSGIFSN